MHDERPNETAPGQRRLRPKAVRAARQSLTLAQTMARHVCLVLAALGYAYAVIGAAHSAEFYRKHAGAIEIPDSDPGFYRGKIKPG